MTGARTGPPPHASVGADGREVPHLPARTDDRIVEAALVGFASRGFAGTSLDALAAELGIRKQTILYWFPSKESLLDAVVRRGASELVAVLEGALAGAPDGPDRVATVMRAVFRYAVRRPALLGLVREVDRLGPDVAGPLAAQVRPLVDRAAVVLEAEMDAGRIRGSDPRVLLLLLYTLVVGVATDVEAQRAVGLPTTASGLRRLRRELFAFVGAALRP
jgi:TetR/AcrR family transcriptional regulator